MERNCDNQEECDQWLTTRGKENANPPNSLSRKRKKAFLHSGPANINSAHGGVSELQTTQTKMVITANKQTSLFAFFNRERRKLKIKQEADLYKEWSVGSQSNKPPVTAVQNQSKRSCRRENQPTSKTPNNPIASMLQHKMAAQSREQPGQTCSGQENDHEYGFNEFDNICSNSTVGANTLDITLSEDEIVENELDQSEDLNDDSFFKSSDMKKNALKSPVTLQDLQLDNESNCLSNVISPRKTSDYDHDDCTNLINEDKFSSFATNEHSLQNEVDVDLDTAPPQLLNQTNSMFINDSQSENPHQFHCINEANSCLTLNDTEDTQFSVRQCHIARQHTIPEPLGLTQIDRIYNNILPDKSKQQLVSGDSDSLDFSVSDTVLSSTYSSECTFDKDTYLSSVKTDCLTESSQEGDSEFSI